MNLLCKIWGHRYDERELAYGVFECNRCGRVTDFNEEVVDEQSFGLAGKFYRIKRRISSWILVKTIYLHKCHDCGKRFNKHAKDCTPF